MSDGPCPTCGNENEHRRFLATDLFFGSEHDFTYVCCLTCGHLRLLVEEHVGGGEFGRGVFDDRDEKIVVGVMDHPLLGWGFYQPRSRWIGQRVGLTTDHAVLDVGCGSGHFLHTLQRRYGCRCTGLDLDPAYEQKAAKDGIRRVTGDFEQFETDERFDLITMFHLVEHLNNPAASIRKAWTLLKPGGYLYVETPAADSLSFKVFRKYWLPLLPPYHRHVFTRQSLTRIMVDQFETEAPIHALGVWVPLEVIVSTWLWFARISPHPFRRRRVPPAIQIVGLAGMTATSLVAFFIELMIGATTQLVDSLTARRFLFAAHQRILCQKI